MDSWVLQYCYLIQEGSEIGDVETEIKVGEQESVCFHPMENLNVIIMELSIAWEEGGTHLHQRLELLKQKLQERLLASVFVLVSGHNDWDEGLREAEAVSGRSSVMEFRVSGGKIARLG